VNKGILGLSLSVDRSRRGFTCKGRIRRKGVVEIQTHERDRLKGRHEAMREGRHLRGKKRLLLFSEAGHPEMYCGDPQLCQLLHNNCSLIAGPLSQGGFFTL